MPAPPPQLPCRNWPCLPVPPQDPGRACRLQTPAQDGHRRLPPQGSTLFPGALREARAGEALSLHPSQNITECSVTRKVSAWGPPAEESPPPRAPGEGGRPACQRRHLQDSAVSPSGTHRLCRRRVTQSSKSYTRNPCEWGCFQTMRSGRWYSTETCFLSYRNLVLLCESQF